MSRRVFLRERRRSRRTRSSLGSTGGAPPRRDGPNLLAQLKQPSTPPTPPRRSGSCVPAITYFGSVQTTCSPLFPRISPSMFVLTLMSTKIGLRAPFLASPIRSWLTRKRILTATASPTSSNLGLLPTLRSQVHHPSTSNERPTDPCGWSIPLASILPGAMLFSSRPIFRPGKTPILILASTPSHALPARTNTRFFTTVSTKACPDLPSFASASNNLPAAVIQGASPLSPFSSLAIRSSGRKPHRP